MYCVFHFLFANFNVIHTRLRRPGLTSYYRKRLQLLNEKLCDKSKHHIRNTIWSKNFYFHFNWELVVFRKLLMCSEYDEQNKVVSNLNRRFASEQEICTSFSNNYNRRSQLHFGRVWICGRLVLSVYPKPLTAQMYHKIRFLGYFCRLSSPNSAPKISLWILKPCASWKKLLHFLDKKSISLFQTKWKYHITLDEHSKSSHFRRFRISLMQTEHFVCPYTAQILTNQLHVANNRNLNSLELIDPQIQ